MNRAPIVWLCAEKLCGNDATHTFVDPRDGAKVRVCPEHRAVLLASAAIVGLDVATLQIVPVHS
jgi:hypothetical protein